MYSTLFGRLSLVSPRLYCCTCKTKNSRSFSPLAQALPERNSPELTYLQSKWASLMSYGLTVDLLSEILPTSVGINTRSARRRLQSTADRMERELLSSKPEYHEVPFGQPTELPRPDGPITLGLDGDYVRGQKSVDGKSGWFEVIAGKSIPSDRSPRASSK